MHVAQVCRQLTRLLSEPLEPGTSSDVASEEASIPEARRHNLHTTTSKLARMRRSSAASARLNILPRRVESHRLSGRCKSRCALTKFPLACVTHSALVRPEIIHNRVAASGYCQSKKYPSGCNHDFSHYKSIYTFHQSLHSNAAILPLLGRQQTGSVHTQSQAKT